MIKNLSRSLFFVASLIATFSVGVIAGCKDEANNQTPTPDAPVEPDGPVVEPTFELGGTIAGLAGDGLELSFGDETITIDAGATTFKFPTKLEEGTMYAVTVSQQPSAPTQACAVAGGMGTMPAADVTSIAITCTTQVSIGGSINYFEGMLVLQNNAGDNLMLASGATTFSFGTVLDEGDAYAVTVLTQPTDGTCVVENAEGNAGGSNVTNINVSCATVKNFNFTGAEQTFVVPAGAAQLTLEAWGAQGATGGIGSSTAVGGTGGRGALASGNLTATPGQTLRIQVGGQPLLAAGGYNGGGAGGSNAGGGGGATDFRTSTGPETRILIAAGGGGGGRGGCATGVENGGAGGPGGTAGSQGVNSPNGGGGFGGNGAAGGAPGIGCGGFLGVAGATATTSTGGNGGEGQGCCCGSTPSGGGGGGGLIGGGGGGGGSAGTTGCQHNDKGGGGGGGGGSSSTSGVTDGLTLADVQAAHGRAAITIR